MLIPLAIKMASMNIPDEVYNYWLVDFFSGHSLYLASTLLVTKNSIIPLLYKFY